MRKKKEITPPVPRIVAGGFECDDSNIGDIIDILIHQYNFTLADLSKAYIESELRYYPYDPNPYPKSCISWGNIFN